MRRPTKQTIDRQDAVRGPATGEFIAPPEVEEQDVRADALPQQEEFWRPPVRFGSVPVEKEPLGWDRRKGFRKLFPAVYSLAVRNLLSLAKLTGDDRYAKEATRTLTFFAGTLKGYGTSMVTMVQALDSSLDGAKVEPKKK